MMKALAAPAGTLPFFMPARPGQRFCLFHQPAPGITPRGAILYVHPFAEELNKSRRMAAMQARAFAAKGFGVLQIDLHGCGDSSGDFSQARWQTWKQDLALALDWLAHRVDGPVSIWGLRLGALLALDVAGDAALVPGRVIDRVILWHPVFKGKVHLDQFLRLRLASQMLTNTANEPAARAILTGGASVEVAGYEVTPELAAEIDGADATLATPAVPVHWFELAANDGGVAPAALAQARRWQAAGGALSLHAVRGEAFWNATENLECPALLAATAALCA
jgi:exosortase A-associated hydrolase 2